MEEKFLFREVPPLQVDVVSSKGSYLIDKNGKKYLDFITGWGVGNAGWSKKEIRAAVRKFKGPDYVLPTYIYQRWEVLAEKLVSLLEKKDYTCFRATGGTEAVEIALKTAKAYNKREKFIAFKEAYHGQSFACMSLVRLPDHEKNFGPFSSNFIQIPAGDWEETTKQTVELIEKKDICAFIFEPIICNLGVVIPPQSFFDKVCKACKENDTIIICDEVATGFGRTGKWFGFEHHNLDPDIITIAKGFSSGYGAIGATIVKRKVAEAMRFDFSNYSTYGWHPLATESAIANIEYLKKNKLIEKSEKSGKYLMKQLSKFCEPQGKGLCIGFTRRNSDLTKKCQEDGLLISALGDRELLFPPLSVTKEEIDKAIKIIQKNF